MNDTWVFGYGSLVSPSSLATTIGRDPVVGVDVLEAVLAGWGRRWNYGVGHVVGIWDHDGRRIDHGVIVALGLIASATESANGVIARVTADELVALDRRERDYDRVDVTSQVDVDERALDAIGGARGGSIVTYVPRRSAVDRYESARDRGVAGIRRTYWDLVDDAFAAFGPVQQTRYRATTPAADIPIVDVLSAVGR